MSGRLGAVLPPANTPTTLYQVPENKLLSLTVRACNRTQQKAIVAIQLCDETPDNTDYIEPDVDLAAKGVIEDSGLILRERQSVVVTTSVEGVNFICWGIEEAL